MISSYDGAHPNGAVQMSNTLESLQDAAILLSQNGSVKERLAEAYLAHLASLEPTQLPENYRGEFRAMMAVESVNDGPINILLDSKRLF